MFTRTRLLMLCGFLVVVVLSGFVPPDPSGLAEEASKEKPTDNNQVAYIIITAQLFEGIGCSTNDSEDTESFIFAVPPDLPQNRTISLVNSGIGGGDRAKITLTVISQAEGSDNMQVKVEGNIHILNDNWPLPNKSDDFPFKASATVGEDESLSLLQEDVCLGGILDGVRVKLDMIVSLTEYEHWRSVTVSGTMKITEDDLWDKTTTVIFNEQFTVGTEKLASLVTVKGGCPDDKLNEVWVELDLKARLTGDRGAVIIEGTATLYEGGHCHNTDNDDSQSISFTVSPGLNESRTFNLKNQEPISDDEAEITLVVSNKTPLIKPLARPESPISPIIKLAALTPEAGDQFGSSIATNGDTIVVGARSFNEHQGAVYIFEHDNDGWGQPAKLTASDAEQGDFFGWSVAISENGKVVVVGAWGEDTKGHNAGAAYIFVQSGTGWIQRGKLTAGDAQDYDNFGKSVAISGSTIVVGSPGVGDPGVGNGFGAAYIFERIGASVVQQAKLAVSDPQNGVFLGQSVAISGDTVVVGARASGTLKGAAYIFQGNGTNWPQQAKLTPKNPVADDGFGGFVAIGENKNTVVVGASLSDGYQGAAYIFQGSGASWPQKAKLTALHPAPGGRFGSSVAISGDKVVVGDPEDDGQQGAAYLFERGMDWQDGSVNLKGGKAKLRPSDIVELDVFGYSVAISADTLVAGAPGYNDDEGAAYVYDLTGPIPTAITLVSFTAQPAPDHITLTWERAQKSTTPVSTSTGPRLRLGTGSRLTVCSLPLRAIRYPEAAIPTPITM
ncbi:MAG: hypothetical protein GY869_13905 [Planctomycetes bacterium]|nr:hypothetical protein [Planctomycetota bacterium]